MTDAIMTDASDRYPYWAQWLDRFPAQITSDAKLSFYGGIVAGAWDAETGDINHPDATEPMRVTLQRAKQRMPYAPGAPDPTPEAAFEDGFRVGRDYRLRAIRFALIDEILTWPEDATWDVEAPND